MWGTTTPNKYLHRPKVPSIHENMEERSNFPERLAI